jgi:hypothetical protein
MHLHSRREFLPLIGSIVLPAAAQTATRYDLLIKGGRVVDPSQSLSALRDVAISGNKIARVAANIPAAEARIQIDAARLSPGSGRHSRTRTMALRRSAFRQTRIASRKAPRQWSMPARPAPIPSGIPAPGINAVETRVFALLNISVVGQSTLSEDNEWVN